MGTCICHKKQEDFSMNDLNGIEKYYSLMSKRKVDILRWVKDSEGPWKTPDSFLCFKQINAKTSPVIVSNEDEIRIRASKSKSSRKSDFKKTSNLHVDQKDICMNLNPVNSTLAIDINNGSSFNWSNDW
jgi:hypothetical protein